MDDSFYDPSFRRLLRNINRRKNKDYDIFTQHQLTAQYPTGAPYFNTYINQNYKCKLTGAATNHYRYQFIWTLMNQYIVLSVKCQKTSHQSTTQEAKLFCLSLYTRQRKAGNSHI